MHLYLQHAISFFPSCSYLAFASLFFYFCFFILLFLCLIFRSILLLDCQFVTASFVRAQEFALFFLLSSFHLLPLFYVIVLRLFSSSFIFFFHLHLHNNILHAIEITYIKVCFIVGIDQSLTRHL